MKTVFFVLVLGLGGGAAAGYFGRPAIDRAVGGVGEVEGVVVAERREDERLVLTLRAGDETILASFRERADDVADLVTEGDTLTVRVGARGVFADDVPIVRLRRAVDGVTEELDEGDEAHASTHADRHGRAEHAAHDGEVAHEEDPADDDEPVAEEAAADGEEAGEPEEADAEADDTEADAESEAAVEPPLPADEAAVAAEIHRRARARRHRRRAARAHADSAPPTDVEATEAVEPEPVAAPPVAEAEAPPAAASES